MKELKKLKRELAKKSIAYIEKYEGENNREQRDALEKIKIIRNLIETSEAVSALAETVKLSTFSLENFYCNLFGEDCKNELDVIFKKLCEPNDYKKNKDKLKSIPLRDIEHVQHLLRGGGNIQKSMDAITQLKKISERNVIGMTSLIDLMNELRTVLFILEK